MESGDQINDLAGVALKEISEISLANYYPRPNCEGAPTQVHMLIWLKGNEIPLTMRMKSGRVLDELIAGLQKHRKEVFGDK